MHLFIKVVCKIPTINTQQEGVGRLKCSYRYELNLMSVYLTLKLIDNALFTHPLCGQI